MVSVLAFVVVSQPSVSSVLEAATKAHRSMHDLHVVAVQEVLQAGRNTRVEYDIAVSGDKIRLRINEVLAVGRGKSDRTFFFTKDRVEAWDSRAGEYLSRPLPTGLGAVNRLIFTLGPVDDLLKVYLDSAQMGQFLKNFGQLNAWAVKNDQGGQSLHRDVAVSGGRNQTRLSFDRLHRLSGFVLKAPGAKTEWKLRYMSPAPVGLRIPKSARRVETFTVPLEEPNYRDGTAATITATIQKAYRNFKSGQIKVTSGGNATTLTMDGARFREDTKYLTYAFMAKRLTILDRYQKIAYSGPVGRGQIPGILAALNLPVDPFARQALRGNVPFQELFSSDLAARNAGEVTLDGAQCDLLQLSGPKLDLMICARRADHLIVGVTAKTFAGAARPISATAKQYAYSGVGRPVPQAAFVLDIPRGYQLRALPKITR